MRYVPYRPAAHAGRRRLSIVLLLFVTAISGIPRAFGQNATVNIGVDAAANHLAISPMIYGAAWPASGDWAALNLPIARAGGEAQTGYNWQIDATNLCQDWFFESYANVNTSPDGSYDDF